MKKLFSFILAIIATLSVGAQSIDLNFTSFSSADQALVGADATNWYHETGSNNRWHHITAINNEALTANGTELDYAKGLILVSRNRQQQPLASHYRYQQQSTYSQRHRTRLCQGPDLHGW